VHNGSESRRGKSLRDVDDKPATSIGSIADHEGVYADRSGLCLEG